MDDLKAMQKVLTESTGFLYLYLEPEDILINLKAKGAISNMETDKIRKKDIGPQQVECLLDILQKKPLTSYMTFMEVLKAARNDLYDRVKEIEKKHNFNAEMTYRLTADANVEKIYCCCCHVKLKAEFKIAELENENDRLTAELKQKNEEFEVTELSRQLTPPVWDRLVAGLKSMFCLNRYGILEDVKEGSILLVTRFESRAELRKLWNAYCDGSLLEQLKIILVTDEVEEKLGFKFCLEISADEEEYRKGLQIFDQMDSKSKGADQPAPYPVIKQRDITVKKHLKTGGFGRVSLAVHKAWGEVAIKEYPSDRSPDVIQNEVNKMWRVITSPYLAHMLGVIKEGSKQIIVMEYFENGNLQDFNRKYMMGCDCWARKVKIILEITLGMNFLHTLEPPVIHRDLKLNNIFVDDRWKVKIGDFGLAVNATSIQTKVAADIIGTCSHIPPEIWDEAIQKPDELCDVFSFGITLFEFLSGKDPWPSDVTSGAIIGLKLIRGKRPDTKAIPSDAPRQIVDIMTNCWDGERNNRPIFQKIQDLVSTIYHESYKLKIHHADSEIITKFAPGIEKGNTLEGSIQNMAIACKSRQSQDSGIDSARQVSHKSREESSLGAKSDTRDSGVGLQKQKVGIKGHPTREKTSTPVPQKIQKATVTEVAHPSVQPAKQQSPQVQHGHPTRGKTSTPVPQKIKTAEVKDATHTTHEPGSWVFDGVIQEARIQDPIGIACDGNAGIIVADHTADNVHVYNEHGVYQRDFDVGKGLDEGETSAPWGVVSTGTTCYLTDNTAYVKVFDSSNGAYKTRWLSVKPGQSVGNKEVMLWGIDMDGAGNVIVGCTKKPYYISTHRQDGSHIHSFNVSIKPYYLAITPQDTFIISNGDPRVEVVSQTGDLLHKVQYTNMSIPAGVHCNGDVIYVCDRNNTNISCLSVSGEYIGCIPIDTSKYGDGVGKGCRCVCVNKEGNKMYVTRGDEWNVDNPARVEVYVRKE